MKTRKLKGGFTPYMTADEKLQQSIKSLSNLSETSSLYTLDTMEKVADFDYEYVSDFMMFDEDKQFVLATWKGSYLGTI
ncbi:MAG: hypothetical protein K2I53_12650 [Lachnospiraceae bacterium]|nr:hypothetical protein [Lachnospiraceae bacterium]